MRSTEGALSELCASTGAGAIPAAPAAAGKRNPTRQASNVGPAPRRARATHWIRRVKHRDGRDIRLGGRPHREGVGIIGADRNGTKGDTTDLRALLGAAIALSVFRGGCADAINCDGSDPAFASPQAGRMEDQSAASSRGKRCRHGSAPIEPVIV